MFEISSRRPNDIVLYEFVASPAWSVGYGFVTPMLARSGGNTFY
jgi:hypothetical protein